MNTDPLQRQRGAVREADLADRVRQDHSVPALQELTLRCYPLVCYRVRWLARCLPLPDGALADAQQEAMVAVLKAVPRYQPDAAGADHDCTLRTFLEHPVQNRFYDFVRREERARKHVDRSGRGLAAVDGGGWRRCLAAPGRTDPDPVAVALAAEDAAVLHEVWNGLTAREQRLWQLKSNRVRWADIARQLHVGERTVKRHWRELYQKLTVLLAAVGG
jgi:RNA polymerase sigma factor (sigma-70 family)